MIIATILFVKVVIFLYGGVSEKILMTHFMVGEMSFHFQGLVLPIASQ